MFLSESMIRAIHADRVREIERATRDQRLLALAVERAVEPQPRAVAGGRCTPAAPARRRRSGLTA